VDQFANGRRFGQIPVDAGVQGTAGVHVTLSGGYRQNPRPWEFRKDSPRQIFSGHVRQEKIERYDIGPIPSNIVEGLGATRSRGHHRHVFLTIDHGGQAFLNQLMPIHRHDTDRPRYNSQRRPNRDCRCRCTRHKFSCSKTTATGSAEHHEN
jgi:hypothetical protein